METERLTTKRVRDFRCPADKNQDFLWAQEPKGIGLRATASGDKAFVFGGSFKGDQFRMTIGSVSSWSIPEAEKRARELQQLIDNGRDPREVKAEKIKAALAK